MDDETYNYFMFLETKIDKIENDIKEIKDFIKIIRQNVPNKLFNEKEVKVWTK